MVSTTAGPTGAGIRPATTADRADLQRLLDQLHPGAADAASLPYVRQESQTLVATEADRVVAVAVLTLVDYGVEAYGMIEEFVVDAARRGAGIGTTLLERCQAWFDAAGADVVFVSALDEQVTGFYATAGFVRCTGPWLARARTTSEKGDQP